MKYFIGLDIGTSGVKAMIISKDEIIKTVTFDYPVYYPEKGWSEQNPQDWYNASIRAVRVLIKDINPKDVEAVSFSGQMHGPVMLAELFFNHSSTETFRDKLLKLVLADGFYLKILIFPKSRAGKNTRKMPLLCNRGAERRVYENRVYEAGKGHRYLV